MLEPTEGREKNLKYLNPNELTTTAPEKAAQFLETCACNLNL